MIENIFLTLSIRFFLFDFILFKTIRNYLMEKHYIFKKLFSCPFCQGFWSGILIFIFSNKIDFIPMLKFSFITAFLSLTWAISTHQLIKNYEAEQQLPIT